MPRLQRSEPRLPRGGNDTKVFLHECMLIQLTDVVAFQALAIAGSNPHHYPHFRSCFAAIRGRLLAISCSC